MEEKINYYKISLEELEALPKGKKPTLLLHACCGPCSCFPLTFLCPHFDVTIYYNNSNIYPQKEFERRLGELRKVLFYLKRDYDFDINLIVPKYDNEDYNKYIEPFKDLPEGQQRCIICYSKRMAEAYDFAEDNGFDYFTTVMTISRQKNSQTLNKIGKTLSEKHLKTKYFFSDFKKNKGQDHAREMRLHYELYNQLYCGCKFTYPQGLAKELEKGHISEEEYQKLLSEIK
ncbi:MAG: epoxyqueuosine reductase QueH [Bacilli bacterium]|nr:epoxyqueuosine reductase QueH [Bacilli bacterium]